MTFALSETSRLRLKGVHPDLIRVCERGIEITPIDFRVTCGVRTIEEQKKLLAVGATTTLKSRHLLQSDGFAHAFDVVALLDGRVRWDWPLYGKIADAMKLAAGECHVPIEWGGGWKNFPDGPHFQLPHGYVG